MKIVESKRACVATQAIVELLYPIRKLVHSIRFNEKFWGLKT